MESNKARILRENRMTDIQIKSTKHYKLLCDLKAQGISHTKAIVLVDESTTLKEDELKPGQLGMIARYIYNNISLSSYMTPEETDKMIERNNLSTHPTSFGFLAAIHGLRKSNIHTILAESGDGKSTLAKKIAIDSANTGNTLLLLTEEETLQYQADLNNICQSLLPEDRAKEILDQVKVIKESQFILSKHHCLKDWTDQVEKLIEREDIKTLIYDNVSTSIFSDKKPEEQSESFKALNNIAQKYEIPVVALIHPSKSGFSKKLTQNDIRGNSTFKNTSSYIFILQTLETSSGKKSFIKIEKSRHHSSAKGEYHLLNYKSLNSDFGFYIDDKLSNRESFNFAVKEHEKF